VIWQFLGTIAVVVGFGYGCVQIGRELERGDVYAEVATQQNKAAMELREKAEQIARLESQSQIVRERVIRETVDRPVYRECAHSQRMLNDINAAITGQSAGPVELPASGPSD